MSVSLSSFAGVLNGPALVPPAVTHALICLHGFGSSGNDLIQLAPPLKASLGNLAETLAVYSPHAPTPTRMNEGLQWFSDASWTFRDRDGIEAASRQLEAFTQSLSQHHAIPMANIALLGFSQGAMTSLYAAPRWSHPVGAVISCSGAAMWQEDLNPATCHKIPTLLLHGTDDDVLPADSTVAAATGLQALGVPAEYHLLPGLGHGIDARTLAHISLFLQNLWVPTS